MKRYIGSMLLAIAGTAAQAQVLSPLVKAHPQVNTARLARIDSVVNEYIRNDWVKGVVVLLAKDNQLLLNKGYGLQDADTKKPMPANAIFRIMSQTKAITSVAIMMLYEEGKLLLDDPIANYIPEFKNARVLDAYHAADTTYTTVPANRPITFRDLLTHTSGIDYAAIGSDQLRAIYQKAGIPSGLGSIDMNLLDAMKLLAKQPLKFQPGTQWQYGLNTDLLGCLVQVISGTTLDVFFKQRIFEPLGMHDTYFTVPAAKASRMAAAYTETADGKIIKWGHAFRSIDEDYPLMPTQFYSGGAGLSSTAYDYAIFLQMLLNKGRYNNVQLLSPRTVEMMTTGQQDYLFNGSNNFGLGFEVVTDKGAALGPRNKGSFAWGGYFGTTYWADPKAGVVALIMTQQSPNSHGDLAAKLQALMYASFK
jgi:CubicO group peptidase (beta-lactamase class C family)